MKRILLPAAMLTALATASHAIADDARPISDFMTMDVCVDANDAIVDAMPGDANCTSQRDIRPGETPPYELRNFAGTKETCPDSGTIIRLNQPVTRLGETRIVSSNNPVALTDCVRESANQRTQAQRGLSIQWHDEEYGFIMGSYSPVALSIYQTPLCRDGSRSSRRFFRGWVIAPAQVPENGTSGYGTFESLLARGKASDLPDACPTRFRRGFTSWTVTDMTFQSGRTLEAIISRHFSRAAEDGQSHGDAMQMEATYWTRDYGLSRWEKWSREDWTHRRTGATAEDQARRLFKRGRCSAPNAEEARISSSLQIGGAIAKDGMYQRTITDPQSGESYTWVLTLCEDYTNTHAHGTTLQHVNSDIADDAYWRP